MIRLFLQCPKCFTPHVDQDGWEKIEHKTHLCAKCDWLWRPLPHPSIGINTHQVQQVVAWSDMSHSGGPYLKLTQQPDGDIVVAIVDENGRTASVEFCTSGSRHPGAVHLLRNLMDLLSAQPE